MMLNHRAKIYLVKKIYFIFYVTYKNIMFTIVKINAIVGIQIIFPVINQTQITRISRHTTNRE